MERGGDLGGDSFAPGERMYLLDMIIPNLSCFSHGTINVLPLLFLSRTFIGGCDLTAFRSTGACPERQPKRMLVLDLD